MTLPRALPLAAAIAAIGASSASAATVAERPVAFSVKNLNRTALSCEAAGGSVDGSTSTIRGHVTGTAAQLRAARSATLYLHGLGLGEFFWTDKDRPGYDYAANLARAGHVSVTIDRLGYGASDKPAGAASCIGGQADIAHQILQQLRSGAYQGATTPAFRRVGLVGHSAGGLISQIEAGSFKDPAAIGVLAYADQGLSTFQGNLGAESGDICNRGGQPVNADGTGPSGYALLGQDPTAGRRAFFSSRADAKLVRATLPRLTRNPCGDIASYGSANFLDGPSNLAVTKPVLLVQGGKDALFPPPSVSRQRDAYGAPSRVRYASLPGSGHALTLDVRHKQLERVVAAFLRANGL